MRSASESNTENARISLEDFAVGDIVLFRGTDSVSVLAQNLMMCTFDHAGLVVAATPDRKSGRGITVVDVLFRGSQQFDLADYEYQPEEVLVRRHRVPGSKDVIAARAISMTNPAIGYSEAKMLNAMLAALVRSTGALEKLGEVEAYHFVCNLSSSYLTAAAQLDKAGLGICVDAVMSPFDITVGSAADAPYYGIVAPHFPTGLLAWVASGTDLATWLRRTAAKGDPIANKRKRKPPTPPSPGFADELFALRRSLGITGRPLVDSFEQREARAFVTKAGVRLAERTGIEVFDAIKAEHVDDMTDEFVSTLAWWLLDGFLRHGIPLGPEHLEKSNSLFDVGLLDIDSVTWTEPSKSRR